MKKARLDVVMPKWHNNPSEWPPIFNRGRLVFEESRHSLTNVGNYYTCAEMQKGLCCNEVVIMCDIIKFVVNIDIYFFILIFS